VVRPLWSSHPGAAFSSIPSMNSMLTAGSLTASSSLSLRGARVGLRRGPQLSRTSLRYAAMVSHGTDIGARHCQCRYQLPNLDILGSLWALSTRFHLPISSSWTLSVDASACRQRRRTSLRRRLRIRPWNM
jgi:hypothetical protein